MKRIVLLVVFLGICVGGLASDNNEESAPSNSPRTIEPKYDPPGVVTPHKNLVPAVVVTDFAHPDVPQNEDGTITEEQLMDELNEGEEGSQTEPNPELPPPEKLEAKVEELNEESTVNDNRLQDLLNRVERIEQYVEEHGVHSSVEPHHAEEEAADSGDEVHHHEEGEELDSGDESHHHEGEHDLYVEESTEHIDAHGLEIVKEAVKEVKEDEVEEVKEAVKEVKEDEVEELKELKEELAEDRKASTEPYDGIIDKLDELTDRIASLEHVVRTHHEVKHPVEDVKALETVLDTAVKHEEDVSGEVHNEHMELLHILDQLETSANAVGFEFTDIAHHDDKLFADEDVLVHDTTSLGNDEAAEAAAHAEVEHDKAVHASAEEIHDDKAVEDQYEEEVKEDKKDVHDDEHEVTEDTETVEHDEALFDEHISEIDTSATKATAELTEELHDVVEEADASLEVTNTENEIKGTSDSAAVKELHEDATHYEDVIDAEAEAEKHTLDDVADSLEDTLHDVKKDLKDDTKELVTETKDLEHAKAEEHHAKEELAVAEKSDNPEEIAEAEGKLNAAAEEVDAEVEEVKDIAGEVKEKLAEEKEIHEEIDEVEDEEKVVEEHKDEAHAEIEKALDEAVEEVSEHTESEHAESEHAESEHAVNEENLEEENISFIELKNKPLKRMMHMARRRHL